MPDDATTTENSSVEGLVNKNAQLLRELKTAKEQLKAFDGVDLDALRADSAKWKEKQDQDLASKGEYEKLINQQRQDHERELLTLQKQLQEERESNRKMYVQSEVSSALANIDVDPLMLETAVELVSNRVSVLDDNGARELKIGDKSVSGWVKDWAKTDVGKRFVLSKAGSGSGAHAITNGGRSDLTVSDWDAVFNPASGHFNMMQQAQLLDEDPALYEKLVKKYETAVLDQMRGGMSRGPF